MMEVLSPKQREEFRKEIFTMKMFAWRVVGETDGIRFAFPPAFSQEKLTVDTICRYVRDGVYECELEGVPDNKVRVLALILVGANGETIEYNIDPFIYWPIIAESSFEDLHKKYFEKPLYKDATNQRNG